MQEMEGARDRLRDAVEIEQTEPAPQEVTRAVGKRLLRVRTLEAEWLVRVDVRADEVHRKAVPPAVVEQLVDPSGHRRRRAVNVPEAELSRRKRS